MMAELKREYCLYIENGASGGRKPLISGRQTGEILNRKQLMGEGRGL